jgi:hypothetical protein
MNRLLQALVAVLVATAGLGVTPGGVAAVDGDGYGLELAGSVAHHQFLGIADPTVSGVVGVGPGEPIVAAVRTPGDVDAVVALTAGPGRTDEVALATARPVDGTVSFRTDDLAAGRYRLGLLDGSGAERDAVVVVRAAVQFDHAVPSDGTTGESVSVQVTALGGLTDRTRDGTDPAVEVVLTPVGAPSTAATSLAVTARPLRSGLYETTLPLSVPVGEYRVFAVAVGEGSLPVALSTPSGLRVSASTLDATPAGREAGSFTGDRTGEKTGPDTDTLLPASENAVSVEAAIGDGAGLEAIVLLVPALGALVALVWSRRRGAREPGRGRGRGKKTATAGTDRRGGGEAATSTTDEPDAEGRP